MKNKLDLSDSGKGMEFPPKINPATGRFEMVSDTQAVRQSIYMILNTAKSERFVRPAYGSGILGYTFMETSATMLNLMSKELAGDITRNEPRVKNVDVSFSSSDREGGLLVYIDYTLRENDKADTVVFPFDINQET